MSRDLADPKTAIPRMTPWRLAFSSRARRVRAAAAVFSTLAAVDALAQAPLADIAQREIRRREALVQESGVRLAEADALLADGKTQEAVSAYGQIYQTLPKAALATSARDRARAGFATASCQWARKLMAEARYAEAAETLNNLLAPDVDPDNREAKRLREQFKDVDRYPPALTPQHIERAKKVESLLVLAASAVDIGDYEKAASTYEDVLRLDAYNTAARRGMERLEQKRIQYQESARDHTRAKMLTEVDAKWESTVPPTGDLNALFGAGGTTPAAGLRGGRDEIVQKLRNTIIPKADFNGTTIGEVIEYLRVRSRDLDPKGRGVDFVLNLPPDAAGKIINLYLEQVPLEDVVRYVTEQAGAAYRVEERAVMIVSISEKSTQILSRSYRVPPSFIQTSVVGDQGAAAPADPFAQAPAGGGNALQVRRMGAKEFLESRGVTFKEGATASYTPATNTLFVRNTPDNIAIVDMLVDQASEGAPKQVIIAAKTMVVEETKLKELGFDWLLGPFNVPGSERVFASGGTTGNQQVGAFTTTEFPFPNTGQSPVTAGLRSSGAILGQASLDRLISTDEALPALESRTPGVLALSGVFTDPQFQVVLRALNQKKGVDLVSSPSVVSRSGQKAIVEIIRDFPYPSEFEPPEIPQDINPGIVAISPGFGNTSPRSTTPITPTTPTTFEYRKVGSLLEVDPVVSEDGRTVELIIAPSNTEFEGFIDYGSDIQNEIISSFDLLSQGINAFLNISGGFYTVDNKVLQPVFRTNRLSTGVTVWDGSTVVLGGVLTEKTTDIQDKVPILGSLPLVGPLWQSKVKQTERKCVIFFVTVKVIDAGGQPLRPQVAGASQ